MVKLDASNLKYFTRDDFRVLTAVEMGMRNHELVPTELISAIAGLKGGGSTKVLSSLLRNKLVTHERNVFDGYKLTYPGYDFLALKTLLQRGVITGVGRQIGMGKESDIFLVVNEEGEQLALKLQRLGRTSFRAIKRKRDYLKHRRSASWLYMSRLGALKEFAFMKALHDAGFPTPIPIECNRHAVLMSLVPGVTLSQCRTLLDVPDTYSKCMHLVARLACCGLIHCDFNEFNIMIGPDGGVTMIDFPQMVSLSHPNAKELFERDVGCLRVFFNRRFGYAEGAFPTWDAVVGRESRLMSLDVTVEASGFITSEEVAELERLMSEEKDDAKAQGLLGAGETEDSNSDDDDAVEEGVDGDSTASSNPPSAAAAAAAASASAPSSDSSSTGPTASKSHDFVTLSEDVLRARGDDLEVEHAADGVSSSSSIGSIASHTGAVELRDSPGSAVRAPASVDGSGAAAGGTAVAASAGPVVSSPALDSLHTLSGSADAPGAAAAAHSGSNDDDDDDDYDNDEEDDEEDAASEDDVETALRKRLAAAAAIDDSNFDRPPDGTRTRPGGGRVRTGRRRGEAYLEREVEVAPTSASSGAAPSADSAVVRDRVKRGLERKQKRADLAAATGTRSANNNKEKTSGKARGREALRHGDVW